MTTRNLFNIALALGISVAPSLASAATEADKRAAIDAGLQWLASTQQPDGRWVYDNSWGDIAATGAALLSFFEEKDNWGANAATYTTVTNSALSYIFSHTERLAIGVEPAGNPDGNGNGYGVQFVSGATNSRATYVTGLVVPGIVASMTPDATVHSGSEAGRTYGDVIQDTNDWFAYAQADPGNSARGGWRYYADYGQADNSTAQWPPVAMLYGESPGWGTVPDFVKTELQAWIDYIQNPNGGSGYDTPANTVTESKTGGLLVEMAFSGYPGSAPGGADNSDRNGATAFLNANWRNTASSDWNGNFAHPYAMWSIYKGLELTIGLDDTTTITNLHDINNYFFGGGAVNLDPGDEWTWWEDYSEFLVRAQNPDGSWNGYSYWSPVLATPWYINILAATEIPDGAPLPASAVLLGVGLVALGLVRRR